MTARAPLPAAADTGEIHARIAAQAAHAKVQALGHGRLTERSEAPELAALHDHAVRIVSESQAENVRGVATDTARTEDGR